MRPAGQTGTLNYTLYYERGWVTDVSWDAGSGASAGTRTLTAQVPQDLYFRVHRAGERRGARGALRCRHGGRWRRGASLRGLEFRADPDEQDCRIGAHGFECPRLG